MCLTRDRVHADVRENDMNRVIFPGTGSGARPSAGKLHARECKRTSRLESRILYSSCRIIFHSLTSMRRDHTRFCVHRSVLDETITNLEYLRLEKPKRLSSLWNQTRLGKRRFNAAVTRFFLGAVHSQIRGSSLFFASSAVRLALFRVSFKFPCLTFDT